MNETVTTTILVVLSGIVVISNVFTMYYFKRKIRNIEDSIHKLPPASQPPTPSEPAKQV